MHTSVAHSTLDAKPLFQTVKITRHKTSDFAVHFGTQGNRFHEVHPCSDTIGSSAPNQDVSLIINNNYSNSSGAIGDANCYQAGNS